MDNTYVADLEGSPLCSVRNGPQRDHRELKKVTGAGKADCGSSLLRKDAQSSIWACISLVEIGGESREIKLKRLGGGQATLIS